ncbi:hypothetical protein [Parahaliea mediterranea]|uniref:hypothetical protein n=1 Tax=Parahaliea mediterranea TaxID=651086 RepID=UPI000E2F02B7|nr:hypothetical protein [Parahaliea mediterranea]
MRITAMTRRLPAAVLVSSLIMPQMLWAQAAVDDSPSAGAMVGDLLVARPMGLVATVGGTAAFLVSLPFTLLAGHASEAAETLMVGPARTTFMRCLGCIETGYTNKDVERYRAMQEEDAAE